LKPGLVNSSLSVHVTNDLVAVEVADDIMIRPLLFVMLLVIAKTQELNSSYFLRDWPIIVLIQQSGRADAVTVFLLFAWNGKALSRPTADNARKIEHNVVLPRNLYFIT
jgi:hypothetical protein